MENKPKKFGTKGSKGAKWARTRAIVLWNSGKQWKAPSWDYTKKITAGVPTTIRSELRGINKLVELICKIDPFSYRVINVFVNLTSNLDVITGDFNYHVLTVVRGRLTWKKPMYWQPHNDSMLDIKKMKAFMIQQADKEHAEQARLAVQLSLEKHFKNDSTNPK